MGLSTNHLRFLLHARRSGVDFRRTLMIGRQQLFLHLPTLQRALADAGLAVSEGEAHRLLTEADGFAEPLFRLLGAEQVDAMDASPYEGANVRHDLNAPLPDALRARYTAVIDSGTLEHVFDFPRALASCMEMVAAGGHLVTMLPANNAMGHGFYQLGPDLFHRALAPEHGYRMVHCVAVEMPGEGRWFEVRDPAVVGARPEWHSREETQLMVCARRERLVTPFATPPQQSDYVQHWAAAQPGETRGVHGQTPLWPEQAPPPTGGDGWRARAWRHVPAPVKVPYRAVKRLVQRALRGGILPTPPAPPPDPQLFVPLVLGGSASPPSHAARNPS